MKCEAFQIFYLLLELILSVQMTERDFLVFLKNSKINEIIVDEVTCNITMNTMCQVPCSNLDIEIWVSVFFFFFFVNRPHSQNRSPTSPVLTVHQWTRHQRWVHFPVTDFSIIDLCDQTFFFSGLISLQDKSGVLGGILKLPHKPGHVRRPSQVKSHLLL